MSRILIFSPYQLWGIHTIYEETIAKACQARGATVEYLLCDGLLPECDQHWDSKANSPRPFDLCQSCQTKAKANMDDLGFPYHWLGSFVSSAEKADTFAWAQRVTPVEFREASFKGAPLGQWVLSSVISYFRQYPPDLNSWHVVSVYRGFLFSAAIVATGICNYLEVNAVDAAILFNGRQSLTRVAFEMFQQRGIRVLTHERAEYQRGHANIRANSHCVSPEPFKDFWNMWGSVPLSSEFLDAAFEWLLQRRYGANLAWIPFSKSADKSSSLKTRLNLNPDKRLWALFTSSTDETAGDPVMKGPFESQVDWVGEVVRWAGLRDDIELVIKVHPNLGGNSYIGEAVNELRIYQEMKSALPGNVRIVWPEDSVSAYSLAEEADVGLTFGSIIGLEMAMLGKPVLLASRAIYEYGSEILTVRSKESLPEMLEKCLHPPRNRDIQRQAFRLAYYYISRFELPFPAVKVLGVYDAKLNHVDRQDLAPRKDESLDRICNFLMNGCALFDGPTAEERSRTTADEDAYFEELSHSSDVLKSNRLEIWLMVNSFGRFAKHWLRRLPFRAGDTLLDLGRDRWRDFLTSLATGKNAWNQRRDPSGSRRNAGL